MLKSGKTLEAMGELGKQPIMVIKMHLETLKNQNFVFTIYHN